MGKNDSETCVVCDAGPIIHLRELGSLHVLSDFKLVAVTHGVQAEVRQHCSIDFEALTVTWSFMSPRFPLPPEAKTLCDMFSLDKGEREAISIMRARSAPMFLTDDAAARLVVDRLGYEVHGTIGVLIRAARRELLMPCEVITKLDNIPCESTLHIKKSLLDEAISKVREHYGISDE